MEYEMNNFMESVEVIMGISMAINIILLILFIVLVSNVVKIKQNLTKKKKYKCSHCGFVPIENNDFCPVCGKNGEGKTLEELKNNLLTT